MKAFTFFAATLVWMVAPTAAAPPVNFARGQLVAWCIVPFDAKIRSPEERAEMLAGLGMKRCAYDWRKEHVDSFEDEILAYKKHGIEFTAFWGEHDRAFELFEKHGLSPQIWKTCPSPKAPTQGGKVEAAAAALAPLAKRCQQIDSKLGLYNHGGWGGEPANLVAVCERLHGLGYPGVGIVYNFHHAHGRIAEFAEDLELLKRHLLCLNLNGMNDGAKPKILPIGEGEHEAAMIEAVLASGYAGPVGVLDHLSSEDAEVALRRNLEGLEAMLGRPKPFPENRLRAWYRKRAEHHLSASAPEPMPEILPAFPGLDGGAWGHWGQNPEADNFDHRLNEVDLGSVVSGFINHFGKKTPKGVAFLAGDLTVLFDPEKLAFVDAWRSPRTDRLLAWQARRYGITSGLSPNGKQESFPEAAAPEGSKYLGYFRDGAEVVFHFRDPDGKESFLNSSGQNEAPEGAGPQWIEQKVITKGASGSGDGAFVIDTATLPYRDANPFKTPMRIGGLDFLPDGRAAVGTLMGDVWLASGLDGDLDEIVWQRHAAGLHHVLGLVVRDGKVITLGRDQVTRLHDRNGDGEADYYECLTNEYPTGGGNNWALTLHADDGGSLYWFTRSAKFGMSKWSPGGRPESIATGLRGTNGTGVSRDGEIVFATVQEGSWTPASAIFEVGGGSYHGFFGPRGGHGEYGYDLPMCFLPRGVDNSCGDITFLPVDERLGPLSGQIVGTSLGTCSHYLILREEIDGDSQGGVVPLPGEFLSGAHRARFNPKDGCLWVAGSDGWQSYAAGDGSLQRVRYTGGEMLLPTAVETRANGLLITLNAPVDEVGDAFAAQWNYLYSGAYGSAEYSAKKPGVFGNDPLEIRSVNLLEGGKKLFVEIPQLAPVMQLQLYVELPGRPLDLYYTVKELGPLFTTFDGYQAIEKQALPRFPVAGEVAVDPRISAQEALGKHLGEIQSATVRAVAGLKFEPARLRLKPGMRTALTVLNADPSMPHNLVLTRDAEALVRVGEGSMKLASAPEGLAKHYTIDDPGVLALSPMLGSGSSYTIYFNTPKQSGEYPYLCTFPGHWQVTRGVLEIAK